MAALGRRPRRCALAVRCSSSPFLPTNRTTRTASAVWGWPGRSHAAPTPSPGPSVSSPAFSARRATRCERTRSDDRSSRRTASPGRARRWNASFRVKAHRAIRKHSRHGSGSTIMNRSTLVDVLRGRALRQKDQAAVSYLSDDGAVAGTLTYSELDQQARSIAAWLQQRDLFGERVILVYSHPQEFLPAFLGCLYAGAVAVPTHLPHRSRFLDRLQAIRADSSARGVLTAAATLEVGRQAFPAHEGEETAWLATDSLVDGSANWTPQPIEPSTLAFLQYTSGSTASPRGVMVSHANLMHNLDLVCRMIAVDSESVMLSWLPFFHDMGLIGGI